VLNYNYANSNDVITIAQLHLVDDISTPVGVIKILQRVIKTH